MKASLRMAERLNAEIYGGQKKRLQDWICHAIFCKAKERHNLNLTLESNLEMACLMSAAPKTACAIVTAVAKNSEQT